jgi:hypothetical protein
MGARETWLDPQGVERLDPTFLGMTIWQLELNTNVPAWLAEYQSLET